MKRILLLMPTSTYRASAFIAAAQRLGVECVTATDRRQALETFAPGNNLTLDFYNHDKAKQAIVEFNRSYPIDAIIPVDEDTTVLAAAGAGAIGLKYISLIAARAAREKPHMRKLLAKAGLPTPEFRAISTEIDPKQAAETQTYPCVLKPTFLSSSRGVVRANSPGDFVEAFYLTKAILAEPDVRKKGKDLAKQILIESYIDGEEIAFEGILTNGALKTLAIFDKPDPLTGPFFEETIYVTPSRRPPETQKELGQCVANAAHAMGIRNGPVHAELRINKEGYWIIEIAARSIGGLCSRALRFDGGMALEEVIIKHAIGLDISTVEREKQASGVMMIPIPKAGILKKVLGVENAKAVAGVEDVRITIPPGQKLVPLPEGNRYPGFIFARGTKPESVEAALREAHRLLEFVIV